MPTMVSLEMEMIHAHLFAERVLRRVDRSAFSWRAGVLAYGRQGRHGAAVPSVTDLFQASWAVAYVEELEATAPAGALSPEHRQLRAKGEALFRKIDQRLW